MILIDDVALSVGGYFGLELTSGREFPHIGLIGYQSARAAFLSLLRAGRPKRVWMPRYICDSMTSPLTSCGTEIVWYDLTDEMEVERGVRLSGGDWLLYVNYFGVCGANVSSLLQRFPPEKIVLDYSQSFFSSPPTQAVATIYSPRKFFGVPDGGLIFSQVRLASSCEVDSQSADRMEHLIRRLGESPEAGYAAFLRAEESLNDLEPRRMSRLTERLLASIDFESVRRKRKVNFEVLRELLGSHSQLLAGMDGADVPLCYPFRAPNAELRQVLVNNRIYVATYWADAVNRLTASQADGLVRRMLPLPIDQRYGPEEMERISSIILRNV
jgi:hypothetical protein